MPDTLAPPVEPTPVPATAPAAGTSAPADGAGTTPAPDPAAPAAGTAPATPAAPVAPAPATDAPPAVPVPESYTLTTPDGSPLDEAARARIADVAKTLGLPTNEAAQAVADLVHEQVTAQRAALLDSLQPGGAEWTRQVTEWNAGVLANPKLGSTPEERQAAVAHGVAVIDRFAAHDAEAGARMKGFLDHSGLGSHPDTVEFFAWLGKASAESKSPVMAGSPADTRGRELGSGLMASYEKTTPK